MQKMQISLQTDQSGQHFCFQMNEQVIKKIGFNKVGTTQWSRQL